MIGVVIPTYNSAHVVPQCIAPLSGASGLELLCVDNASTDGTADGMRAAGVAVEQLDRNRGFSAACNTGARRFAGAHPWLAFVNPDVRISAHALLTMAASAPDGVDALAPLMVDESGAPQPDVARPVPTLASTAARYLIGARADVSAQRVLRQLSTSSDRYFDTDVTSGGCLLVRTDAFDAVGGFSEAYFLNFEDVELCLRLRQRGGGIAVDTAWDAVHAKGSSSRGVAEEQRMLECARAEMLFFERNRRRGETLLVVLAIFLGATLRLMLRRPSPPLPLEWMRRWQRTAALARIVGGTYRRVLTSTPAGGTALPLFIDP